MNGNLFDFHSYLIDRHLSRMGVTLNTVKPELSLIHI